jgi:hypothetical protein
MHWLQVVLILTACDLPTTASLLSVVIGFMKKVYLEEHKIFILYFSVAGCYDWLVSIQSTSHTHSVISQMIPAY